ncbi:molybdenum ABC transporter ATP-binding protein [Pedobacter yulinensis]|uniref:Molybdenum ABC transporter ATP-binding protein n=1 Tax=Pedobacter yulinensis TaxID=2126353 RepID=A0A2T3HHF2_9SPHI|nr:ATP-binding cassette domain-containing protein [Pedobacter yulinensis]PST81867.1 molybdenum ABC transporter ATP-binding protein [Pedobacter yulinensis]
MARSIRIHQLKLNYAQQVVFDGLDWAIGSGENWLLSGASGSGKTSLAKVLAGLTSSHGRMEVCFDAASPLPACVMYVESWYQFKNLEGVANFYYQQRYTSLQTKDVITVGAELEAFGAENGLQPGGLQQLASGFGFSNLMGSTLLELSSGEHKKLQLLKALWLKPQFLIIDQPYTGLDSRSRTVLNTLLDQAAASGVQLILISNGTELPACINRFAELVDGMLLQHNSSPQREEAAETPLAALPEFLRTRPAYATDEVVRMENVNISYGNKQVLKNITWEIRAGEKWLLQGHNGSGKSTLLSLINGDHPQAYANTIYLFGRRRGSGESIWDIKQHIGLISPELHWYFDAGATVFQSIASGFFDSIGLYRQPGYRQSRQVDELISFLGLSEHRNELLSTLPLGKQRLALLGRTIIKNPELLVLDEPCQGLDDRQTQHFNRLVDALSVNGMTLIYVGHFDAALPACIEKKIVLEQGEVKLAEDLFERI